MCFLVGDGTGRVLGASKMTRMGVRESDLVRQAAAELYGLDPDQFIARRAALAVEARTAGQPAAAKQIAGLHKPTRSAWTLNSLARTDPDQLDQLVELGDQLREAEHNLDGEQLRELSRRRGQLVESLARVAFTATGQRSPGAAVREEVRSTLSAALADADVANRLTSGTLLRAARWDGFGTGSRADLFLVAPPTAPRSGKPAKRSAKPVARNAGKPARATDRSAEAAQLVLAKEQRARKQQRIAAARKLVAAAERDLSATERSEQERARRLGLLEAQIADARRDLDRARVEVRRVRSRLRTAEEQLRRLDP